MHFKRIPESQGWLQRTGEWVIRQHTFMPRMIDLEVSRICNLSCPACMRRADSSLAQIHKNDEVFCTLDRFTEMHKQIPTLGTLNFMGDGEPLLNPEILDIIHYAAVHNIHTIFTTNGTLFNKKIVSRMVADKVFRIHMSVDAAERTMYEKMRVGAVWGETLENLYLVGNSGIPLCINTVLTQQNIQQMPDIVHLAKNVGAREVSFLMPLCAYGPDIDIRPKNNWENQQTFLDTYRLCAELNIRWTFPLTLDPTFRRFSFPFIRPEISIEGDLWACCYSLGRGTTWMMGEEIHIPEGTYVMGNMFKEGLKQIWYGDRYKELRQKYIDTELPKGTIISRGKYVEMIKDVESRKNPDQFAHCEICPARWGTACS